MTASGDLSEFGAALGTALEGEQRRHRRRQRVAMMVASLAVAAVGVGSLALLGLTDDEPNVADGTPIQPAAEPASTVPVAGPTAGQQDDDALAGVVVDEADGDAGQDEAAAGAAGEPDAGGSDVGGADTRGADTGGSDASGAETGVAAVADETTASSAAAPADGDEEAPSSGEGVGPTADGETADGETAADPSPDPTTAAAESPSAGQATPATCDTSTTYLAADAVLGSGTAPASLGPLSVWAEDAAGQRVGVTNRLSRGLGVDGGRYDFQIDFDPVAGSSEQLILAVPADVCRLTLLLTMLTVDDGLAETGSWAAFDSSGSRLGGGRISAALSTPAGAADGDRHNLTLDVPPTTAEVVVAATGYEHGQASGPGDNNSDFALRGVEITTLD